MNRLRAFGRFLYDFIIGDDPVIAVAVVAALGLTALIAHRGVAAWWVTPLAVVLVLAYSVQRATAGRGSSRRRAADRGSDEGGAAQ
jgi:hypothetical protein